MTTANTDHGLSIHDIEEYPFICEQQEMHYHPLPVISLSNTNVSLYGYFQSYKYFEQHRDTIFRMIALEEQREEIRNTCGYFDDMKNGVTVSMHFRLGDYKNNPAHVVLGAEYYHRAIERMQLLTNAPNKMRILYFCEYEDNDDVQHKINYLVGEFPTIEFVKVDDKIEDWKQLLLMSACDSHIIANSTFSWWGAYINTSQSKNVIYPKEWFGPNLSYINMETTDLFPVGWSRL
jgi:hypothetical protein